MEMNVSNAFKKIQQHLAAAPPRWVVAAAIKMLAERPAGQRNLGEAERLVAAAITDNLAERFPELEYQLEAWFASEDDRLEIEVVVEWANSQLWMQSNA